MSFRHVNFRFSRLQQALIGGDEGEGQLLSEQFRVHSKGRGQVVISSFLTIPLNEPLHPLQRLLDLWERGGIGTTDMPFAAGSEGAAGHLTKGLALKL